MTKRMKTFHPDPEAFHPKKIMKTVHPEPPNIVDPDSPNKRRKTFHIQNVIMNSFK
jgi:hypothetical protein